MQELFAQINQAWNSLTLRQRVSVFISAGLTVAAVMGIVYWARQPSWAVLYTGLDPRDAQTVVQELQAKKIPLNLTAGGTAIEVPAEQVDKARMELAAKNLPGSGRFGFQEMFAQDNIAQSNQMQRIRQQKALEDELARTIESLDEVRTARVHLVLPGDRVFVDDKDVAKASVTLSLKPGRNVSGENVRAIAYIVSGAVPELPMERVSVVDTQGHLLWEGDGQGGGVVASRQVEMRSAVERDVNSKVARVLEPIVGAAGCVVKTSADLEFQKVMRREHQLDPNSGVIVSEEKSKKKSNSSNAAAGVPGTASNLPGGAGGARPGGSNDSTDDQTTVNNYDYSVKDTTVEEPIGEVKRLSVAVLVDQAWPANAGPDAKPTARTDEEMGRLEDLVKAAISFNAQRGDVVKIDQAPFQRPAPEVPAKGFDINKWLPYAKWPALIVLTLLAFLLFYRPMIKTVGLALRGGGGKGALAGGSAAVQRPQQLGAPSQLELMRQRLATLALEQPEGMAQTVRVWLHETAEGKE